MLALWIALGGCGLEAEASAPPAAPVAEAAPPAIRVRAAEASVGTLDLDAMATGQLYAFKSATIAAEVPGRVIERSVEQGATTKRGTALFRLDRRTARLQLEQARANEEASDIDLQLAERELVRGDQLLRAQDIAQSHYDQLAHTRDAAAKRRDLAQINRKLVARNLADAKVRAPFAGTVVTVHAEAGDYVTPGAPLLTLADLSRVRLRVGLTAAEAHELSSATAPSLTVRFDELGGLEVPAVLRDISPLADPRSGTYPAELWLDQPPGRPLRQGMIGRIDLSGLERTPQVLVPRVAISRHEGRFTVWMVEYEDGRPVARRRSVTLGRHDAEHVEIQEGLTAGASVVVDGIFALAEGIELELDGTPAKTHEVKGQG
ncbi:MAG: efflux RND transporter periplasmic adaptor subunit [Myxococcota bacterium]